MAACAAASPLPAAKTTFHWVVTKCRGLRSSRWEPSLMPTILTPGCGVRPGLFVFRGKEYEARLIRPIPDDASDASSSLKGAECLRR
jgi:hypothetical protein